MWSAFLIQGSCVKQLSGRGKVEESKATKQIVALLSAPIEKYNNVVTALKLSNYPRVMEYLDDETNKVMATVVIQSVLKNNTRITTVDKVYFLYTYPFFVVAQYAFHQSFYFLGWSIVWTDKRTHKGFGWHCSWWGEWKLYALHSSYWVLFCLVSSCKYSYSVLFLTLVHALSLWLHSFRLTKMISRRSRILWHVSFKCCIMMILKRCLRYLIFFSWFMLMEPFSFTRILFRVACCWSPLLMTMLHVQTNYSAITFVFHYNHVCVII